MVATTNIKDLYLDEIARTAQDAVGMGPDWLAALRRDATRRFRDRGFPTRRDEEWRFTNLLSLLEHPFRTAGFENGRVTSSQLAPFLLSDLHAHRLVFINGRFSNELSELNGLPVGATVTSLAIALIDHADLVEPHLAHLADAGADAFAALNTAMFEDGAFIHLRRGVTLETPLLLLYVSNASDAPTASYPRTLIVAEEQSQVTVVESFVGLDACVTLTNAVTEIVAANNSAVDHYKLNYESTKAFHIATTRIGLARDANFASNSFTLGSRLTRNDIHAGLFGTGIECTLNGLYLGRDRQLIDNHTAIDHAMPHCASHELYKGILDDYARGVFNGKIFVRTDAQKTDAKQTNQTLLLSGHAQIDTKPQLEIFADDVRCTHGATVGQLSPDALFYLRSRGIGKLEARAMLTYAFANDVVNRVKLAPLREELERTLFRELMREDTGNRAGEAAK